MIALNYRDSRPIYEQIKESIRKLILSGAMSAGERLPSVRELASDLAINPNTIQRAYRELESEGFIYSIAGKGSFAADWSDISTAQKDACMEKFAAAAKELLLLGVSADELSAAVVSYSKELLQ